VTCPYLTRSVPRLLSGWDSTYLVKPTIEDKIIKRCQFTDSASSGLTCIKLIPPIETYFKWYRLHGVCLASVIRTVILRDTVSSLGRPGVNSICHRPTVEITFSVLILKLATPDVHVQLKSRKYVPVEYPKSTYVDSDVPLTPLNISP